MRVSFLFCLITILALPVVLRAADPQEVMAQSLEKAKESYDKMFLGHTRDDIVKRYGAPSHTVKMDDGRRILEYNARHTYVGLDNRREQDICTMRFWLTDSRVTSIDQIGDGGACLDFVATKQRSTTTYLRDRYYNERPAR